MTSALAAAAGLLLCLAVAGCTPEPPEQGAPTTPEGEQPPPSGSSTPSTPSTPSAPESDEPTSDDGTATGAPEDEDGAPDDAGGPDEEGDANGEDEDATDQDINATDDWQAPDDVTAEGPTAAPALPEVNGQVGEDVALPTEVVVSLTSITTTTLTAETPGEYSGPAVVVGVRVTNESDSPQPVGSAVVSLAAEDGEMGVPTWASPNDPLQGEVPAGTTAEGTYVFMLDPADERSVSVRVNYSAGEPVATFTGTTS
ncbi:hypothetical protein [Brachybacterium fresconis]|uniref:Cytoskeletal protein RodZ n=1 Tax=Brachybacterium fresconis TaxID=173363 RepID=A0ABS4YM91_9MICO|nr:hypothetical protein [Brachybacterium fresconis]MBP2409922.1 cytoskeletal protein RodZ [Brachybacterium fresconis]